MLEKCYEDVKYIFSFIPDHEKQNVKRAMGPYKLDTYFALDVYKRQTQKLRE